MWEPVQSFLSTKNGNSRIYQRSTDKVISLRFQRIEMIQMNKRTWQNFSASKLQSGLHLMKLPVVHSTKRELGRLFGTFSHRIEYSRKCFTE